MQIIVIFIDSFQYIREMLESIFDKSIRVCFTNMWSAALIPEEMKYFLKPVVASCPQFKIVRQYKPHIQIFSVYRNNKKIKTSNARIKIFYTPENVNRPEYFLYKNNCIDSVNLSMGYDYLEADNYLRFPLWLLWFFSSANSKDDIKIILNNSTEQREKTKFCSLIASHDTSGLRTNIYNDISKIAKVNCPGKLLHNDDTLYNYDSLSDDHKGNKFKYLQPFKFNICPENSISKGYVTEKLFECLLSGCIPVYNGWSKNPEPDIINPNIILWYDQFDEQNNKYTLNEVRKLHEDDKYYNSFIEQPFFCDTAVDKIYDVLSQFNEKIRNILFEKN